jgi:hypothetical protein
MPEPPVDTSPMEVEEEKAESVEEPEEGQISDNQPESEADSTIEMDYTNWEAIKTALINADIVTGLSEELTPE